MLKLPERELSILAVACVDLWQNYQIDSKTEAVVVQTDASWSQPLVTWCALSIMAPKKKQKTVRSMEDVPAVQMALDQWLTSVYALRHNVEGDVKTHAWPVEHGGTFLEIADRAWQDEDRLVTATHRLCQKAGMVSDELSVQGFKDSFMTMQAGLAERDTMFISKGEVLSMRLDPDADPNERSRLFFDNGSVKGLGCAICLIGLLQLTDKFNTDELGHPKIQELLGSMLKIPSIHKQMSSALDSQINRVIKQNQDAAAQPVTSFGWSILLRSISQEGIDFDTALQIYNEHPQDGTGSGAISIDNRKTVAIKHWMSKTSEEVIRLVESAQHDVPFNMGFCGDQMSQIPWLFLGSSSPVILAASPSCGLVPLEGEATVQIDWNLEMTPVAQELLFSRLKNDFDTATSLVEVKAKKKYRAKEQDLQELRNLATLWSQVRSLCEHQLNTAEFEDKFRKSNHVDEELSEILVQKPKAFAVSMMPSQRRAMQVEIESKQAKVHGEVEQQRLEVRSARFEFFKKALKQDQLKLSTVEAAPSKLAALQRRAEAVWREEQAAEGEKAVNQFCNKFMRVVQAKIHNVAADRVHVIGYVDFNVPSAATKARTGDLAKALLIVNELQGERNIGLCDFPDVAKASSKRGLADEEADIQSAMWVNKLNCDTRYMQPFELPPHGEAVLNMKINQNSTLPFDCKNRLHYLGIHFMDKADFGRMRLVREITEAWMDQKLKIPGFEFSTTPPQVPDEELKKIPGADIAMGSFDSLKLEVLTREGTAINIKSDEAKFFRGTNDAICDEFEQLVKDHQENHSGSLSYILQPNGGVLVAADTVERPGEGSGTGEHAQVQEFESEEKLAETDAVEETVVSEVPGVSLIRGKSGSIYLVWNGVGDSPAETKVLPKKTQLGGYGSGAYAKSQDPAPGIEFKIQSDSDLVQFDESSLKPESSNVECWSFYKMLVTVEKVKRLAKVNVSFCKTERKSDAESLDGFNITMVQQQKYVPQATPSGRAATAKNFFRSTVEKGFDQTWIATIFRFRFEAVGSNIKVQKPYVITKTSLKLNLKKPIKALK
eukprot:s492_g23.t1